MTADSSGNATEATFTPFGRLATTTAAAPGSGESGGVESLGYDESGLNLECVVRGSSKVTSCPARPDKSALLTSYSYKDKANPFLSTKVENPESHSVFACYNHGEKEEAEAPKCPASEENQPAGSLQNKNDQLSAEHELKFAYNTRGQVTSSTDADGHATGYEYDEKGNLKKITPPVPLSATTIAVDGDNRPHVITDGAGHIETITYDNGDQITKIEYSGTGTAKTVNFEYDADGNLLKREDSTGTAKYTVDPLNRLTKEELPGGVTHSQEYDAASNMISYIDGGGTTTYKYNGLNELESMTEPNTLGTDTFAYDNDHRLKKITYPSGAVENYKLDPSTGRPETITPEHVTGTSVPTLTYAYKEGENDTSVIQGVTESTGNKTSYTYDALKRLTKTVTTGTNPSFYKFKLDGAGNRTEQKVNFTKGEEAGSETTFYAYNAANELECRQSVAPPCSKNSSTERSAYEYDKGGEQTAIVPKGDTGGATFAYNAASQLSTLTPTGEGALSLTYGGTGQDDLITRGSSVSIENSLLGITREDNSGNFNCFERTPNGLLIDIRTPTGNYNPLYDGQGEIIGLVSSTGKVERTFRYGPYGENTHSDGTQTIPYFFGYKGGYRMPGGNKGLGNVANGLYHYGQRYYDPTTGRWTQQDPLGHLGSTTQGDRFLFAGSDPVNRSDPSGEVSKAALCVAAALFCAGTNSGDDIVSFPARGGEALNAYAEKAEEFVEPDEETEETVVDIFISAL